MADQDDAPPPAIPLVWKDGVTGQEHGRQMLVQKPTQGEVNLFSQQRIKTCADCKFFDRNEKTVAKFRETDFYRKLKHEYQWKPAYLPGSLPGRKMSPGDPDELGLCGMRSGTVVGPRSKACDQYRLKSGR